MREKLEKHYRDMQDMEFTVESGTLYMLQTRNGKRSPAAAFQIAVDMANEGLITVEEALERIKAEDVERLFYPVLDAKLARTELASRKLASGINAVPGAAVGKAVFTAEDAEHWAAKGEKVILVRRETSPEDVGGMYVAQGILTATGGKTSHAAVVARGWGKCCIVGARENRHRGGSQDDERRRARAVREGEWITLDGGDGTVYSGQFDLVRPEPPKAYATLMKWADKHRKIGVRTNADTPHDARVAREMGAEGIGLCRTEHMFFKDFEHPEKSADRQLAIQEMILADNRRGAAQGARQTAAVPAARFHRHLRGDGGLPVTIRLIDPPLHEFVPHDRGQAGRARARKSESRRSRGAPRGAIARSQPDAGASRMQAVPSPIPEILEMQVRAIIEAAIDCQKRKIKVLPEIMIPLTLDKKELKILDTATRKVADEIIKDSKVKLEYLVGTMIELPRAALACGPDRRGRGVLLVRHQRPDADDHGPLPRRRRPLPAGICRPEQGGHLQG